MQDSVPRPPIPPADFEALRVVLDQFGQMRDIANRLTRRASGKSAFADVNGDIVNFRTAFSAWRPPVRTLIGTYLHGNSLDAMSRLNAIEPRVEELLGAAKSGFTFADAAGLLGKALDAVEKDLVRIKARLAPETANCDRDACNVAAPLESDPVAEKAVTADKRIVFVVHGRNDKARLAMFDFLRSLDLKPLEWTEAIKLAGKPNPYVGEVLDVAFANACAVVVLMTPDEIAHLHPDLAEPDNEADASERLLPRPNVVYEAGMAMGRDPDRVVLVQLGNVDTFSDIHGRHFVKLNDKPEKRQEFCDKLRSAGCTIDTGGKTDWYHVGKFDEAVRGVSSASPVIRAASDVQHEARQGEVAKEAAEKFLEWLKAIAPSTPFARTSGVLNWISRGGARNFYHYDHAICVKMCAVLQITPPTLDEFAAAQAVSNRQVFEL